MLVRRETALKGNRKYLIVVALLAVIAVVFGVTGTVAPSFEPISPQQSPSESVPPYFIIPPNFDSGWVDVTNRTGSYFNITHNLNTSEAFVDFTGKRMPTGDEHRRHIGGTAYALGLSRTYGGTSNDYARSVVQTRDGGYAIVGGTQSYGAGNLDAWLVKTDWTGNVMWSKTYGGAGDDEAYSVIETIYGEYALAGYTHSQGAGKADFWLAKTDGFGNLQWSRTYGGAGGDFGESVVQTAEDGYAIAGRTDSLDTGNYDFWLVKTDYNGNMQWNRTYGGMLSYMAYSLVKTSDEGYALTGFTRSFSGYSDFWLVKTDSNGNAQWNRTYGVGNENIAYSVIQTQDGGYAVAGRGGTVSRSSGVLLKTDSNGIQQWIKSYPKGYSSETYSVVQADDGGYALAGVSESYDPWMGGDDFYFVKTDFSGNVIWSKIYGGTGPDWAQSVVETGDGGNVLAGITYSPGAGDADFWLVKTEAELGLAMTALTNSTITLYRGKTDSDWNFVRVRMWTIEEPTWQYGDINQDGVVDAKDLYILSKNYGKTFSVLSLGGIAAVAGIHMYKKRKQQN